VLREAKLPVPFLKAGLRGNHLREGCLPNSPSSASFCTALSIGEEKAQTHEKGISQQGSPRSPCYRIAKPPSTRMVSPVTKSDAREARYTAAPATSSG